MQNGLTDIAADVQSEEGWTGDVGVEEAMGSLIWNVVDEQYT
jgi:hypothetical protein